MKKSFIITIIFVLLLFSCKTRSSSFLPKLNKEDSKIVKDFFFFVHRDKEFRLSNLQKISEVQRNKYYLSSIKGFKRARYLPIRNEIMYISQDNNLLVKNIESKEAKILKEFSTKVYSFDLNSKRDKILIKFNNYTKVYSFPNFKLLDGFVANIAWFDIRKDKIYHGTNRKLYSRVDKESKLLYGRENISLTKLCLLNNGDIFLNLYIYPQSTGWKIIDFIGLIISGPRIISSCLLSFPDKYIKHNSKPLSLDIDYKELYRK